LKLTDNKKLVEAKILNNTTAYIKINDALGNNNSIEEFDKAIDTILQYKNLVIDLTQTPSGGNSTVARCIMGRFISKPLPYQMHEFDEKQFETKRKWVEYVTPRKAQFEGNLFVLVGHWTGSMAEGIAIGFDGLKRAKIIGTEMAGLLGAINGFMMSETKIGFQIPTERLYHINGTPRENFKPNIVTQNIDETIKKMNKIK
jgi:carboxyl-terminal processing protease